MEPNMVNGVKNPYLNGVGSSESSRTGSPVLLTKNAPTLPQMSIPANQLPPGRPPAQQIQENLSKMNISAMNRDITPFSSPSMQRFATSTPNSEVRPPNSEVRPPNSEVRPNSNILTSNSNALPPSSAAANSNAMLPNRNNLPQHSNVLAPHSNILTTNSNILSGNTNVMPPNSNVLSSNSNAMSQNSNVLSSNSNIMPPNTNFRPQTTENRPQNADIPANSNLGFTHSSNSHFTPTVRESNITDAAKNSAGAPQGDYYRPQSSQSQDSKSNAGQTQTSVNSAANTNFPRNLPASSGQPALATPQTSLYAQNTPHSAYSNTQANSFTNAAGQKNILPQSGQNNAVTNQNTNFGMSTTGQNVNLLQSNQQRFNSLSSGQNLPQNTLPQAQKNTMPTNLTAGGQHLTGVSQNAPNLTAASQNTPNLTAVSQNAASMTAVNQNVANLTGVNQNVANLAGVNQNASKMPANQVSGQNNLFGGQQNVANHNMPQQNVRLGQQNQVLGQQTQNLPPLPQQNKNLPQLNQMIGNMPQSRPYNVPTMNPAYTSGPQPGQFSNVRPPGPPINQQQQGFLYQQPNQNTNNSYFGPPSNMGPRPQGVVPPPMATAAPPSQNTSVLHAKRYPTQATQPIGATNANIGGPPMPQSHNVMPGQNMTAQGQNLTGQGQNLTGPTNNFNNQGQNLTAQGQSLTYPQSPYPNVNQPRPPVQNPTQPAYNTAQYQNQNYQKSQYGQQTNNLQNVYNNQGYNANNQGVLQSGFNKLWGAETIDLLQTPNILPPTRIDPPKPNLGQEALNEANCSPEIFRCTLTKMPETNSLLQKSRLPLGVLIHPFKDLNNLPVIQCTTIVRCRACRTYINPFVFFVDSKRWKCNLCYRVNDLPEEFLFDPVSKTYGDPSRRPEVRASTIEYIAPAEYMLRPPQPAVYLFLLDVSRSAVESGYLHTMCNVLTSELDKLPGDTRTQVGFVAYNSSLHFYNLGEGLSQPHELTVLDINDVFLPCPDNLLVNLNDRKELVLDLLAQLPTRFNNNNYDTNSALGAALQAAHKLMGATGGRVSVFQCSLPNVGPGALTAREDPSNRASADIQHLNPANDFYKRLALDFSGQQIAVDLFVLNSMYVDVATISGISRFSGGCLYHVPLFKVEKSLPSGTFERTFRRYLSRKIGFEAVMRIRCTRGLAIHTFHGNFFVRSTDLLSLPNINPDAGFGMQVSIEESLSDLQTVCFQAALLYTSSKAERRIRVHTLCVPVSNSLTDIIHSADQQCIVGLLAKMAVDRSMQSNLSDAREAFLNVAIDILSSYRLSQNMGSGMGGLSAPGCLKLLPLYISALLKYTAFRTGQSTRLDDRLKAMCDMKTKPLSLIIQNIYPDLYPVHDLDQQPTVLNDEEEEVHFPPLLQLSARSLNRNGAFLLDNGEHMILLVCSEVSPIFLSHVLGCPDYRSIPDALYELPFLDNKHSNRINAFINYLNDEKPFPATLQVIREDSVERHRFFECLIEDRVENALSYHEFLQHLKTQVK